MQIDLNIAEAKLPTWTRYATDTDNMREVSTAALGSDAKQKFISTAHGGAIPICSDPTVKSFIEQVSSEARLLRWLACSAMPSLYDLLLCDRDVLSWPKNTCFLFFWTTVENPAQLSWVKLLLAQGQRHLSLHHDGVLVSPRANPCGYGILRYHRSKAPSHFHRWFETERNSRTGRPRRPGICWSFM